jgi:hypothetical protein
MAETPNNPEENKRSYAVWQTKVLGTHLSHFMGHFMG